MQRGVAVILADRNVEAGRTAAARIGGEFRPLDLASLAQIRAFAAAIAGDGEPLDLLVNNAGVLPSLERRQTAEGFELTLGIALLGHFALTAQLLPALRRSPAARVVGVTSLVAAYARIDFDDLQAERQYETTTAYNQSKLAALMFALELEARARRAGLTLQSLAAHPGVARTAIGDARLLEPPRRWRDRLEVWAFRAAMALLGQSPEEGARSIVHAATSPDARGGELYAPGGFREFSGPPQRITPAAAALDAGARERLWAACEQLTGVKFL